MTRAAEARARPEQPVERPLAMGSLIKEESGGGWVCQKSETMYGIEGVADNEGEGGGFLAKT